MKSRIKALCCLLSISSLLLLLLPIVSRSQQNAGSRDTDLSKRPVKLSFKEQRFTDVIATLSTSLGLNILADDEPLPQEITLNIDGSATDALDQVCEAFDYRWKQRPNGVIVMYKSFHRSAEHPQFNLPELQRMAHSVAGIFKTTNAIPVDTDDNFTARTNLFFGLLTPPQVEMLRAGKMLHGSDLNAVQAEALQTAILRNMFFGQGTPWQELLIELDGLDRSFFQIKAETATYFDLYFGVKAADGTPFSQFIAGMQSHLSSKEVKKP